MRTPYVAPDYYVPPMPASLPFSGAERLPSAPSSSLSSAAFSAAPSLSSSRLTLPASLSNPDVRAPSTRTVYSPATEPQPAAWQFHETVARNASPSFTHSSSLPIPRQPSHGQQRSNSRELFLAAQRFAPPPQCKWP